MDELIDFEELIDFGELINLQLSLSLPSVSQSSQEPITDVLDKMYEAMEAMDESNLAIDNAFKEIAPDDDIVKLDDSENSLATASLCNDESNLVTDDLLQINDNDMVKTPDDDTIDLDEFESISANACFLIDDEKEIDNDKDISHLQKALSYEVPTDIEENVRGHRTEYDVIKEENITSTNNYGLKIISVESATSGEREIGTVNPVSNKLKTVRKQYENGLETKAGCIIETYITENIVTTNSDINVKYEYGIERSKTDCKNTRDTTTEDTNEDINSDSDYDPLDFEFISEQDACKAGIVTRISKVPINETKNTNTASRISKNAKSKLQTHIQQNYTGQSTSNIDNRPRNANENIKTDSDYNPLDFEFISEHEACKAGIVTRICKATSEETKKTAPGTSTIEIKLQTRIQQSLTGQSTSNIDNRRRKNEASLAEYLKYSKQRYQRCYPRAASELHVIPEGERYLDIFRGEYAPGVVNNLHGLTNKRVSYEVATVAMAANFDELAYRGLADGENERYKADADDCYQKILSTYPRENRRKRRRH